jgi:hypothetical protein
VVRVADKDDGSWARGAIGVLPWYLKPDGPLADVPLEAITWPLGPPQLAGRTIADLGPDDHLISYPEWWLYGRKARGLRCTLSVALVEPRPIHFQHLLMIRLLHRRFFRVLTSDPWLLRLPNAVRYIFGDSWVREWIGRPVEKTRMLSLIASPKRRTRGHRLRHHVVQWLRDKGIAAGIYGGGYSPVDDKAEALAPYRYSVVIENTRQPGYITEKLIDALVLETVPIYWGAPDVGTYFDADGLIVCENFAAICEAIGRIGSDDYERRRAAISANRREAYRYTDTTKAVAVVLRNALAGDVQPSKE